MHLRIAGMGNIELHGRAKDVMWLNRKWVTTQQFDRAMSGCRGIDFYRCVQTDMDRLEVDVVPALGAQVHVAQTQELLQDRLGISSAKVRSVRRLEPEQSSSSA